MYLGDKMPRVAGKAHFVTFGAVTRIRTWVVSATTRSTNHYTITANAPAHLGQRRPRSPALLKVRLQQGARRWLFQSGLKTFG